MPVESQIMKTKTHLVIAVAFGLFAVAPAVLLSTVVPLPPDAPQKHIPAKSEKREEVRKLEADLVHAAEQDDAEQVAALLKKHVSPNTASGDETTPLHWAAYNDDLALVKLLLASGATADRCTRLHALTPLHMAAESGDAAVIEALLKAGAKADAANESGTTPLMIASASGSTAAVATLLAHEADVNARENTYGQTALFFAAARDRAEVVRLLLSKGADAKVKTTVRKLERISVGVNGEVLDDKKNPQAGAKKDATSASAKPVEHGKEEAAKKPAAKPDDKVKDAYGFTVADRKKRVYGTQQIGGMTALLVAARDGQRNAVSALLDAGDDINQTSDTDHATALILALINGHYDLAQLLLERGADPKLATSDGVAPLFAVIDVQWSPHTWYPQPVIANEHITYLDIVKNLLQRGANPNATIAKRLWFRSFANDETWFDVEGSTPFLRAALASDLAAMQLLVEHGADPNLATKSNDTPLMAAAGIGWAAYWTSNAPTARLDAVKYCLDHGANVNAKDVKGYTALHGAAFRGDNETVKYLISVGADVHATAKDGDTVADFANGLFEHAIPHEETVALLEHLGSANSHNCRSNECVVPTKEDKPAVVAEAAKTATTPVRNADSNAPEITLENKLENKPK
jgi:ankyrin repeat protein